MKFLLLLLPILISAFTDKYNNWEEWKEQYRPPYENKLEEIDRHSIWLKNKDNIIVHNKKRESYTMGLNQFSDLTLEEFKKRFNYKHTTSNNNIYFPKKIAPVAAIDWRMKGAVTAIKDQGNCGSCYSFSAISALESMWQIYNGTLYSLSEQQLVDCSEREGNEGCNGGRAQQAFEYTQQCGSCTEDSYYYIGFQSKCFAKDCKSVIKIMGYSNIIGDDVESIMETVLNEHPISVVVNGANDIWKNYKSGVISDLSCFDGVLNHAVSIVGYNRSTDPPYWIVRNSWGQSWGENGYIRILMGDDICGIAEDASFPII